MATTDPRALLERAYQAAVEAADPAVALEPHWPPEPSGRLVVLAFGKAAERMARAAERRYASRALEGFVLTPHGAEAAPAVGAPASVLERRTAGHPLPDAASLAAGERALRLAKELEREDLLLVLISGGGSALLCAPAGVAPEEHRALYEALLRSGADIHDTNTVRRALSQVKGGRLAAAAHPARVVGLALSDVVGDRVADIASGPTAGDPSDAADALRVLERCAIEPSAPVREALERAAEGRPSPGGERVPPGDSRLATATTRVVASNQRSLEAAAAVFARADTPPAILASGVTGEAREAGALHAAVASQVVAHGQPWPAPVAVLSGGETTLRVRGDGRGGRNSAFALSLALHLADGAPVWALAADSDGIDGVGGHGGAFVTPELFAELPRSEAERLLAADDSYAAFERAGHLFVPGPTGTNVNDLRFVLVGA